MTASSWLREIICTLEECPLTPTLGALSEIQAVHVLATVACP